MKNLVLIVTMCLMSIGLFGQQEGQFTQFMYNKLSFNPAYAGATESLCLTGLYRNQWMGLEGSPNSQLISFNAPLSNNRVGLGLTINHQNISIFNRTSIEANYAYRFRLGSGYLGVGLQGSVQFISGDFTDDRLSATTAIGKDQSIGQAVLNKSVPNFGAGLFYQAEDFYVGFGMPRFLKNNIDLNDAQGIIGTYVPHAYFMIGGTTRLSENLNLQPQALFKYVDGAPLSIDLNVSLEIQEKFTVGTTLRTGGDQGQGLGESIDLLLGTKLGKSIFFGLSYDINLSKLKTYNNGSLEAVLRYCFGKSTGDVIENPRYFN